MANPEMPRKGRILVADDDRVISKLIATYFESHGYEVITASNGREALGMVQALEPDLVILDVLMPVMTGLEVCASLTRPAQDGSIADHLPQRFGRGR